jgi:predicted amidohydrolase
MRHFLAPAAGLVVLCVCAVAAQEKESPRRCVRIGHYQCECRQGEFEANLKTVIHGLELAAEARVEIVSFPESFLTGYFARREDAWKHSFSLDSPAMREVLQRTARFDILFMVGFNERRGEKLFNTVAVIDRGKLVGKYSKAFPCVAYFTPGRDFPVFEKRGLLFGVVICADGGYIEPARILALKGARVIFAPHFNFVANALDHYQTVRSDHVARAVENGVYFVRGNNCTRGRKLPGWALPSDGAGYGDSYILNPNGQVVAGAGLWDECLMIYNLDLTKSYYAAEGAARSRRSAAELFDSLRQTLQQTQQH